jgi:hypothetical protein
MSEKREIRNTLKSQMVSLQKRDGTQKAEKLKRRTNPADQSRSSEDAQKNS